MLRTTREEFVLDLGSGHAVIDCLAYAFAGVQVVPLDYSSTTAVVEVKVSLHPEQASARSFSTSITPNMTSRAIEAPLDIRDFAYLHFVATTADAGKSALVSVVLSSE